MDIAPTWPSRVRGCLLGGALGDALGRPLEGAPAVTPAQVDRSWNAASLRWTDDTALMVALAEHLATAASHHDLDLDELAVAYAREWAAQPQRGYGAGPPRVFETVLRGGDWRAVAGGAFAGSGSKGNGAAMRAAPCGVVDGTPTRRAAMATAAASVTHTHPDGTDGAVVIAAATRACLTHPLGTALDLDDFLTTCLSEVSSPTMQAAVARVPDTLKVSDPSVVARHTGNGILAAEAVPAALSAFLHHADDPVRVLWFAVSMGGDTDTIATMAGCLAGALHGQTGFPERSVARLEQRDRILAVADLLASRTGGASGGGGDW